MSIEAENNMVRQLAEEHERAERWKAVAKGYYDLQNYSIDVTVTDNPELYVFDRADVDACDEAYDAEERGE